MKSKLAAVFATLYFISPMSFILLILVFMPLLFVTEVGTVLASGFSGPKTSATFIGICGLFIGISMLIPALRRMYKALPWLYSLITIFFINLVIMNIGLSILNYGYEVTDTTRHMHFFQLMILFVILARLAMCVYLNKKPLTNIELR
ncbi:hypothetical protein ACFVR1_09920 [Psychrobacillus sp. NPDC058041]|uniref:hypothetical protein n=1 Tax=Psychrobacillus sp. NPDC058041 TaxID=3346310 RepID=UPI0036DE4891